MNRVNSAQPLSAKNYVVIALAGLIFAAGFSLFYVYRVRKLVENGVQGQVFYLLLIPWALSCAAFLFGAMKSYARFTHKHLGNVLELGGPVVLFCLVLWVVSSWSRQRRKPLIWRCALMAQTLL